MKEQAVKMRSREEILKDWKASKENDERVQDKHFSNVYVMKNDDLRAALRQEYIRTLPEDKQLAILMHEKTCHLNHTDACFFYYEIKDFEDDWGQYEHKRFLEKARKYMKALKKVLREKYNITTNEVGLARDIMEVLDI